MSKLARIEIGLIALAAGLGVGDATMQTLKNMANREAAMAITLGVTILGIAYCAARLAKILNKES